MSVATAATAPAATAPAATGHRRPVVAAAAVGVAGVLAVVGLTLAWPHGGRHLAGTGDDATLIGTVARPALQTQGLPVKVALAHGSVLATVTGPETPGQGLPFQETYDTVTWIVRLGGATTDVPIRLADFDTLDHGGVVGHPYLVPHTPAPPSVLRPGRSVTFEVRETMAIGEGLMRYAPDGRHIEAKWDYEIEND